MSLASVFELGATSQKQPQCTATIRSSCWTNRSDRAGDIQYVGAGRGTAFGDPFLYFGISTHQDWANLNTMTPYVDVDTDGDDFPDIELFVQNYASAQGRTDVLLVYTVDYKSGDILDLEAVNLGQFDLDTNVYDTNVVMLPVDLAFLADAGYDLTGPDAADQLLGRHGQRLHRERPGPHLGGQLQRRRSGPGGRRRPDLRGVGGSRSRSPGSGDALVFHYRNGTGHRAEVVTVPEPPAAKAGSGR